jgi:hypothetical protein
MSERKRDSTGCECDVFVSGGRRDNFESFKFRQMCVDKRGIVEMDGDGLGRPRGLGEEAQESDSSDEFCATCKSKDGCIVDGVGVRIKTSCSRGVSHDLVS